MAEETGCVCAEEGPVKSDEVLGELEKLLRAYRDKRVIVIGTTCTGKTTLLQSISYARDMDDLVFSHLTADEKEYVCQEPWTLDIGKKMIELTQRYVHVMPGSPVFGTVVLKSDFIIYLKISDELLK